MSEDYFRRVEFYHVSLWTTTVYNSLLLKPGRRYRVATFDCWFSKEANEYLDELNRLIDNDSDMAGIHARLDEEVYFVNSVPTLDEIKEELSYA